MTAKFPPHYAVSDKKTGAIITKSITTDYDEACEYASNSPLMREKWEVVELEIKVKRRAKK